MPYRYEGESRRNEKFRERESRVRKGKMRERGSRGTADGGDMSDKKQEN